jgi:hypothetical protein
MENQRLVLVNGKRVQQALADNSSIGGKAPTSELGLAKAVIAGTYISIIVEI